MEEKESSIVNTESLQQETSGVSTLDSNPIVPAGQEQLIKDITEANSDNIKSIIQRFNVNCAQKDMLRVAKCQELEDRLLQEFGKRPMSERSNKDLLDALTTLATLQEKSQKSITSVKDEQMIQLTQQNNTINVNVGTNDVGDRESRERVMDVANTLLKLLSKSPDANSEDVIDIISEDDKENK